MRTGLVGRWQDDRDLLDAQLDDSIRHLLQHYALGTTGDVFMAKLIFEARLRALRRHEEALHAHVLTLLGLPLPSNPEVTGDE